MKNVIIILAIFSIYFGSAQTKKTISTDENITSEIEKTETKETENFQKETIKTYKYGKNGIESIVYRKGKPTILISNFNARPELVKEVVNLVQVYFMKNLEMRSGLETSFKAKKAEVFGKIIIVKSKTAIDVQFHYEKVVWKSGLIEVYEKPAK